MDVGFEDVTVEAVKISVIWDITLCSETEPMLCFEGTYHLHLQGKRVSHAVY
jgi:hypothetical protein